jgi:Tol biopolymer transport system component
MAGGAPGIRIFVRSLTMLTAGMLAVAMTPVVALAPPAAAASHAPRMQAYGELARLDLGPAGAQATDSVIGRASVSANGRYVAFASLADNLVGHDRNETVDVFVRDRTTERTVLVSATPSGRTGNGSSQNPALSADGRWVAFESYADDLVAGGREQPHRTQVYLRDLQTGRTVSLSGAGNRDSGDPAIDAHGEHVAFGSAADELTEGDHNQRGDVLVWDRSDHALHRVSVGTDGSELPGGSGSPSLSADGSKVAFITVGTRGGGCTDVFVKDRQLGTVSVASVGSQSLGGCGRVEDPALSGDGSRVAFTTTWPLARADHDYTPDVYLRDLMAGTTTMISAGRPDRDQPGRADRGSSYMPALSADGRMVAFTSFADDLQSTDATPYVQDAYLRDTRTGRLLRLAGAVGGQAPSGSSYGVALTPDAAHIVFGASAENLVRGDNNHHDDVFALDRSGTRFPSTVTRAVDRRAPDTTVAIGPLNTVPAGVVRFAFVADESPVSFVCMFDNHPWHRCADHLTLRVRPGRHMLQVSAVDAAGNVDASPAGRVFRAR